MIKKIVEIIVILSTVEITWGMEPAERARPLKIHNYMSHNIIVSTKTERFPLAAGAEKGQPIFVKSSDTIKYQFPGENNAPETQTVTQNDLKKALVNGTLYILPSKATSSGE